MASTELYELWDSNEPFHPESLSFPPGLEEKVLAAPDDEYRFLHDCAIVAHRGILYAAWYNCPRGEMQEKSVIRGRRSTDGGASWSDISVFAEDPTGRWMYVPPWFASTPEGLFLLVTRMTGVDLVHDVSVFRWEESRGAFEYVRTLPIPFLGNTPACRLVGGRLIVGGRRSPAPGALPLIPAVLISDSGRVDAEWRTVDIAPGPRLPDGTEFVYPETGLDIDGAELTALVRNDNGSPLLYRSSDSGEHWTGPFFHNYPLERKKITAGRLSGGERYVIGNLSRYGLDKLVIAFSSASSEKLSRAWLLQDGYNRKLDAHPEWSYPAAWEFDGRLYVIYTSAKTGAALSILPLEAIR